MISMSHPVTLSIIDKLGEGHDLPVVNWKQSLLERVKQVQRIYYIYTHTIQTIFVYTFCLSFDLLRFYFAFTLHYKLVILCSVLFLEH